MKTTIELPENLFKQAKRYAEVHRITMKTLVEQGLRTVMTEQPKRPPFKLRDASVTGKGLTPEFRDAGWERVRDTLYEGRG